MATNRTVTLKDGTTLTGEQAQVYGRTASDQPITADALAPVTPINVPPPPIDTSTTGTLEYFNQLATRNDADRVSRLEQQKEGAQNDWLSSMLNSTGELGATDQAYRQGGVDTAEAELKDIDTQILAESEALRKQIEEIQSGAGAATVSQRNAAVSEAQRVSLRKQADLAIIQLAKQGKYDSARAIADRAVASLMEAQKNKNLVLRQVYEDNKEEFDTQEQRQFEVMYKEKERQLANEEYRLRAEFDQKIQQSDPGYKLDLAYKQAQIDKTYAEVDKVKSETGAKDDKALARVKDRVTQAEVVIGKVGEALMRADKFGATGFIGGTTKAVSGTPAYILNSTLDTIKANLGFAELQAMREASPTGGALGQVAVQELNMLQATIASLDTGLDSATLTSNLNQVVTHYRNWLNTVGYELAPDGSVIEITD